MKLALPPFELNVTFNWPVSCAFVALPLRFTATVAPALSVPLFGLSVTWVASSVAADQVKALPPVFLTVKTG